MTPAQTALDILNTIPAYIPCCDHKQEIPTRTIDAIRNAVTDAVEDERLVYALLHRLRPLVEQHYARMRGEANVNSNSVTEHWASQARELMHSVNARLGVNDD